MPTNITGLPYVGVQSTSAVRTVGATGSPEVGGTVIALTSTAALTLTGFVTPSATVGANMPIGVLVAPDTTTPAANSVVVTAGDTIPVIGACIGSAPSAIGTSVKAGALAIIQVTGVVALVAGTGGVTGGQVVMAGASGTVVTAASPTTNGTVGIALNTATATNIVYVVLQPSNISAQT